MQHQDREFTRLRQHYRSRQKNNLYSFQRPEIQREQFTKFAMIARHMSHFGRDDLSGLSLLDVGCGTGNAILEFQLMGFSEKLICGVDLLEDRIAKCCKRVSQSCEIFACNFLEFDFGDRKFDVIHQSVVISSILDSSLRESFAKKMASLMSENGMIISYDFRFNNPKNSDVRGLKPFEIREFWKEKTLRLEYLTIAPPISRYLPAVFFPLVDIRPLRSHCLAIVT